MLSQLSSDLSLLSCESDTLLLVYLRFVFVAEQAYGVSYLPSMGRDGCSSYTLAGATIDDSDDLVNTSYKRDNEVLRSVERQMVCI